MTVLLGATFILGALLVIVLPLFSRRGPVRVAASGSSLLELDEAYRSTLADLQDTELDWQVGNLGEQDYESLRSRYRLRAASILEAIDQRRGLREAVLAELEQAQRLDQVVVPAAASGALATRPRSTRVGIAGGLVALAAVAGIVALSLRLANLQAAQAPLSTPPLAHAHLITVDEDGTLWLGHHDGLLRSSDGQNWASSGLAGDLMGLVRERGRWLAFGHDVLLSSSDEGRTWARLEHDLPGTDVHGAQQGSGGLYVYIMGHGTFQSADGRRWERTGEPVPQEVGALALLPGTGGDLLFIATGGTVLRSADRGRTWAGAGGAANLALTGFTQTVAADPTRGALYAATSDGVYRSLNGGSDWSRLPYRGAAVAVGARGDRIALVDERGQFFLSRDGGGSWLANP